MIPVIVKIRASYCVPHIHQTPIPSCTISRTQNLIPQSKISGQNEENEHHPENRHGCVWCLNRTRKTVSSRQRYTQLKLYSGLDGGLQACRQSPGIRTGHIGPFYGHFRVNSRQWMSPCSSDGRTTEKVALLWRRWCTNIPIPNK